jgi:hypothetical protein
MIVLDGWVRAQPRPRASRERAFAPRPPRAPPPLPAGRGECGAARALHQAVQQHGGRAQADGEPRGGAAATLLPSPPPPPGGSFCTSGEAWARRLSGVSGWLHSAAGLASSQLRASPACARSSAAPLPAGSRCPSCLQDPCDAQGATQLREEAAIAPLPVRVQGKELHSRALGMALEHFGPAHPTATLARCGAG